MKGQLMKELTWHAGSYQVSGDVIRMRCSHLSVRTSLGRGLVSVFDGIHQKIYPL